MPFRLEPLSCTARCGATCARPRTTSPTRAGGVRSTLTGGRICRRRVVPTTCNRKELRGSTSRARTQPYARQARCRAASRPRSRESTRSRTSGSTACGTRSSRRCSTSSCRRSAAIVIDVALRPCARDREIRHRRSARTAPTATRTRSTRSRTSSTSVDAINRRNFVSYGFTTRILGRFGGVPGRRGRRRAGARGERAPVEARRRSGDDDDDATRTNCSAASRRSIPIRSRRGCPAGAIPPFAGKHPTKSAPDGRRRRASSCGRASCTGTTSRASCPRAATSRRSMALVRVTPVDWLGFSYNTTFDVEASRMLAQIDRHARARAVVVAAGRPTELPVAVVVGIAYRFVDKDVNRGSAGEQPRAAALHQREPHREPRRLALRPRRRLRRRWLPRDRISCSDSFDTDGNLLGPRFLERDYFMRLTSPLRLLGARGRRRPIGRTPARRRRASSSSSTASARSARARCAAATRRCPACRRWGSAGRARSGGTY